jgi:hypothetical protein
MSLEVEMDGRLEGRGGLQCIIGKETRRAYTFRLH